MHHFSKWILVLVLTLSLTSVSGAAEPSVSNPPGGTGTITFPGQSSFETTLYELRYLGLLKSEKKQPFLVMAGRGCNECDANTSIYIHSPSDGPMEGEAAQRRYSYPGKSKYYATGKLVEKTRAYIGTCIPGGQEGVAWYMQSIDKKGKWQSRFFIVKVTADAIEEKYLSNPEKKLNETLRLVRQGMCKELKGVDGYTEP